MIVTLAYIQHAEPVMTYTDDARSASLNVPCHHSLQAQEQMVGNGWWKTGQAHSLLGV